MWSFIGSQYEIEESFKSVNDRWLPSLINSAGMLSLPGDSSYFIFMILLLIFDL